MKGLGTLGLKKVAFDYETGGGCFYFVTCTNLFMLNHISIDDFPYSIHVFVISFLAFLLCLVT